MELEGEPEFRFLKPVFLEMWNVQALIWLPFFVAEQCQENLILFLQYNTLKVPTEHCFDLD